MKSICYRGEGGYYLKLKSVKKNIMKELWEHTHVIFFHPFICNSYGYLCDWFIILCPSSFTVIFLLRLECIHCSFKIGDFLVQSIWYFIWPLFYVIVYVLYLWTAVLWITFLLYLRISSANISVVVVTNLETDSLTQN